MKCFFAIAIVFSACTLVAAQEKPVLDLSGFHFEYEKECGSPFVESQLYDSRKGKIVRIINGTTVVFEQAINNGNKETGRFLVRLAGIDPKVGAKNRKSFLVKNILNKKIDVIGNTSESSDKHFFGILRGAGFGDVNRHMFEVGMAKFLEPGYFYSVSDYTLCTYKQELKKAEIAKIGLWAKR